jgi:3-hydroxyisobutyrate dehydrogenase
MRIGVAGLGKMGAAIAGHLIDVGHGLTVWNRSADKAKPLADAGAQVAKNPGELATTAEIVITSLTDADALDAVYNGTSGLLDGDVGGKLFIEMSTVQPATAIALGNKVRGKNAAFVECPVGGTVGPAREGKLLGLLGAEPADAERARPVLDQLCRRVEHCGPVGAGSAVKLAVNLPLMVSWQAFGEAFALCRDVGLEPQRLLSLFTDISATSNALKARAPMLVAMLEGRDPGPVTFDIDVARKDLRSMLAEAKVRGVELPLVERTLACFDEASRNGLGKDDGSRLTAYWPTRGPQA